MKNQILILLCGLFICSSTNAQKGTIHYSPAIYKEFKAHFYSQAVQEKLVVKGRKSKNQNAIEKDFIKFIALSPSSKLQKIDEIGACHIRNRKITSSELKNIKVLFEAFEAGNEKGAIDAARVIMHTDASSSTMTDILSALRSNDESNTPQSQSGFDVDDAADVIVIGSTIAGALVGGKLGAKAGKASGKVSGGMLKKIHKWIFGGGGDGFMPGPNGEGCEPPYINF